MYPTKYNCRTLQITAAPTSALVALLFSFTYTNQTLLKLVYYNHDRQNITEKPTKPLFRNISNGSSDNHLLMHTHMVQKLNSQHERKSTLFLASYQYILESLTLKSLFNGILTSNIIINYGLFVQIWLHNAVLSTEGSSITVVISKC